MLLADLIWFSLRVPDTPGRPLAWLMQIVAKGYAELCGDAQAKGGDHRGSGAKSPGAMVVVRMGWMVVESARPGQAASVSANQIRRL
jgi:hypothetical protein